MPINSGHDSSPSIGANLITQNAESLVQYNYSISQEWPNLS